MFIDYGGHRIASNRVALLEGPQRGIADHGPQVGLASIFDAQTVDTATLLIRLDPSFGSG